MRMTRKTHIRPAMKRLKKRLSRQSQQFARGQALVEYALITVLLVVAITIALMATGPAIGNVFSNTVFNLIGAPNPSVTPLNPTEFWDLVTAVASYTPDTVVIPTNTLAPPTDTPTVGPSPTHTPPTPSATPTSTETPGPSPTPDDIIHDAPFYDNISNSDWWRIDSGALFTGFNDWQAEWFAMGSSSISAVESALAGSPTCTSSHSEPDIEHYWQYSGPTPGGTCSGDPWRTDNFATRWTRIVSFEEDTTASLTVVSDDGIRVFIDGSLVSGLGNWGYHGDELYNTTYTFTGGVDHTVVVEHFEGGGGATMVFKMAGLSDDVGACDWTMSDEAVHSPSLAWSDSPGRYYANNSTCHIALRGAVNLGTLTEPPRMTFWNQWDLDNYDKALLQIREYDDTNSTPWYTKTIHENYSEQLSWLREDIDLTDYVSTSTAGGPETSIDWTGKTIEFRFVLEADGSDTESGWWIDDVTIEENVVKTYTIGFFDDFESGDGNWVPGGTWSISGEHTRSGGGAYTDSSGTSYPANANSSLELDGLIDLTVPESVNPELVFYHSWDLASGDSIFVEASTDQSTWTSLTEDRAFEALQRDSQNNAFVRETISLATYQGQMFYLRFRLETNSSSQADGSWIDDFAIQNHPTGNLPYPFYDNMEGSAANWLPDGQWAISPEEAYSGSAAWSDSPGGVYYSDDSNTSIQTALPFLMPSSLATNPELSFWHKRYLGRYDKLYVEVSTDDGGAWSQLWTYEYSSNGSDAPFAPDTALSEFNKQVGWEYVSIDMRSYISDTTPFLIRFRLDALTDDEVRDGVWIDDVRLGEHVETPHSFPFYDDMEGTNNWRLGGTWEVHNEAAHSGTYALSDSPSADYIDDSWSVAELINPVDLTGLSGGDFPILSWWDRFRLDRYDKARVQVSQWVGPDWDDWAEWDELAQHYNTDVMSWNYRHVDLRPYIGEKIRIRFVVDALVDDRTDPGWWIDDVSVELYDPTVIPLDYYNGAETASQFITDGTWGLGEIYRGTGSGPASLGSGVWTAYFYDLQEWTCGGLSWRASQAIKGDSIWCDSANRTFTLQNPGGSPMVDVDFDCGSSSSPHPDGTCNETSWKSNGSHDYMAIMFERNIIVDAGIYEFTVRHDDGAQIWIDGSSAVSAWYDTGARDDTVSQYLTTGTHNIQVWYYENTGGAVVELDVSRQSFSFHDSPGGDYQYRDNMSMTFRDVLDMTGAVNPSMSWYETYNVNDSSGACIIAEVSFPYIAGQFNNWIKINERCDTYEDTWSLRNFPLRPAIESELGSPFNFDGQLMTFRFRLDARYTSDRDDGWWIDDLVIAD
jgi:Flp pilus assembly pilin Flp